MLFLCAGSLACSGEYADGTEPGTLAIPSWEEFKASFPYHHGTVPYDHDYWIVQGDIRISSEAKLREYYEKVLASRQLDSHGAGLGTQEEALIRINHGVQDWWPSAKKLDLRYCVGDFAEAQAEIESAMRGATRAWSDVVGVNFPQDPFSAECVTGGEHLFVMRVSPGPPGKQASAPFPDDFSEDPILYVYDDALDGTPFGETLQDILVHELGHVLGFKHEFEKIPNYNNGGPPVRQNTYGSNCPGYQDPGDWLQLSSNPDASYGIDEMSVMNYPECRNPEVPATRPSVYDYAGAVKVYGLAPALISAVTL